MQSNIFLLAARRGLGLLLGGLAACQAPPTEAELGQLQQLDAALQTFNSLQSKSAADQVERVGELVERNQYQRRDVLVLEQAHAIRARAALVSRYLHQLRQRLDRTGAGQRPVGRGAADTLQQQLRSYSDFMRQYLPDAEQLGLDAEEDAGIRYYAGTQLDELHFAEFYYGGESAAEARAMLALHEQQVLRLATDALNKLAEKVNGGCGVFDRIGAMAVPEANVVREGETYRAGLFLTSSRSNRFKLTVDGSPLLLDPRNGWGQVRFRVPADAPPGPAAWEGTIQGRFLGRDTTYRVRVPYQIERK